MGDVMYVSFCHAVIFGKLYMISLCAYNCILLMYVACGTGSGESTRYVVASTSP